MRSSPYQIRLSATSQTIRIAILLPGDPSAPVECLLETVALSEYPSYETVSYAWGEKDDRAIIKVDGIDIGIPRNLSIALWYLRQQSTPVRLWADAICINQEDAEEKAHQVSIMGDIFHSCLSTYIWLGTPFDTDNATELREHQVDPFHLVSHFARDEHLYSLPCFEGKGLKGSNVFIDHADFDNVWSSFTETLQKPWWSRLWCVQECLLSTSSLQVVLGHWRVPWNTVQLCERNYRRHLADCCSEAASRMPDKYVFFPDLTVVTTHLGASDGGICGRHVSGDLDRLLRTFEYKVCQNPRDKIYGMLGMVDQAAYPSLKIDYSLDVGSVYKNVMEAILSYGKGDLACLTGLGYNSEEHGLPSWVRNFDLCPDIRAVSYELTKVQSYELYDAARGMQAAVVIAERSLALQGIFVDTVDRVGKSVRQRGWKHVGEVILEWLAIAGVEDAQFPSEKDIESPRWMAFCCTVVANVLFDGPESRRRVNTGDIVSLTKSISLMLEAIRVGKDPPLSAWIRTFVSATYGRAFFCTKQGLFGLCHPSTKPGDEVWVLSGGRVPSVLRDMGPEWQVPGDETDRRLIGDAYAHSLMDGEVVKGAFAVSQVQKVTLR